MKTRHGWLQGYNAQIVVTTGQIILAAGVTTAANDVHQLTPMLDQAQAIVASLVGKDAELGAAVADAGYRSDANTATETDTCELFIATRNERAQRAALRDVPLPRGQKPKTMTAREHMQRKLRTKRGRTRYRQHGASVEPVFGQVKDRQGVRRFSMRGLDRCHGEWLLDAAVHNLRRLHRDSVRRTEKARKRAAIKMQNAAKVSLALHSALLSPVHHPYAGNLETGTEEHTTTPMPPTTNHRLRAFQRAALVQGYARTARQLIHCDRHARRKPFGAGVRVVEPCRGDLTPVRPAAAG